MGQKFQWSTEWRRRAYSFYRFRILSAPLNIRQQLCPFKKHFRPKAMYMYIKCLFIRKMSSFKWTFISISESTWLCVTSPKNAFCSVDRITTCKVLFWGRVSFLKGQHRLRNSKTNSWKKRGRETKNKQTNRWYQIVILTGLETLLET